MQEMEDGPSKFTPLWLCHDTRVWHLSAREKNPDMLNGSQPFIGKIILVAHISELECTPFV